MFKYERSNHYTGLTITHFEFRLFGFSLFDYYHSRERSGRRVGMVRLGFFTMFDLGLFYGQCNFLQGYGGFELWAGAMRYCPTLLRGLVTWAVGYSNGTCHSYYSGRARYVVHRFSKLAFCSKRDNPLPETDEDTDYPDWYDTYDGKEYDQEEYDFAGQDLRLTDITKEEQEYYESLERSLREKETEYEAKGLVKCDCGTWVKPGTLHYPGNDPENGPAHTADAIA